MAAKNVKAGSRDYCFNCGKVIVLRAEGLYRHLWVHIDREDPQQAHLCQVNEFRLRAESKTYCNERIHTSWHSNLCLRPIKDEVRRMCGIHAGHARRAEERDRKYKEKWELNDYISNELQKIGLRLREEFGLTAKAEYDFQNHTYTGNIIVDPVELISFLNDIAGNPPPDDVDDDDTEWEETGN